MGGFCLNEYYFKSGREKVIRDKPPILSTPKTGVCVSKISKAKLIDTEDVSVLVTGPFTLYIECGYTC